MRRKWADPRSAFNKMRINVAGKAIRGPRTIVTIAERISRTRFVVTCPRGHRREVNSVILYRIPQGWHSPCPECGERRDARSSKSAKKSASAANASFSVDGDGDIKCGVCGHIFVTREAFDSHGCSP